MTIQRIFPSRQQIGSFRTPLTAGETSLIDFLDKYLPASWEIYVQPYLNNDRPDIVLLHPLIGLQIIEVKDWAAGLYQSDTTKFYIAQENKWRTVRVFSVRDKNGEWQRIESPISQVERYRNNLVNLYMPRLGEGIDAETKRLAPLKVSLYFHNMTTGEAKELTKSRHCVVFGYDALATNDISKVVPDHGRDRSYYMSTEIADELRTWLMPPFHAIEQGTDIELTAQQLRYSKSVPSKKQILHGVPGSGKTLVLAQRAASIASLGKMVLILTFNITLWHYVHDQINRARYAFDWKQIEIRHFHEFCWNYFSENGIAKEQISDEDYYYRIFVPQKVIRLMNEGHNIRNRKYDAILIDEGQDYEQLWYEALELFLAPKAQVLFVVDERQNIYGRELSWTETRMELLRELKQSFRLPSPAIDQANRFAQRFLSGVSTEPIQLALPFDQRHSHLLWRNVADFQDIMTRIKKAVDWLRREKKIHPADIVVLVPNHIEGMELVHLFERLGIRVNHVFEEENGSRRHKRAFWMLDSRLKMSTIHSFKGWELVNVILLTPDHDGTNIDNLDNIIYTALTRTRENLIVFNRMERYSDFGADWPSDWE